MKPLKYLSALIATALLAACSTFDAPTATQDNSVGVIAVKDKSGNDIVYHFSSIYSDVPADKSGMPSLSPLIDAVDCVKVAVGNATYKPGDMKCNGRFGPYRIAG